MPVDEARKWLIISSLSITGMQIAFLIIAPSIGFPLSYPKNLELLQIVSPVFLGYLGAASHFIFRNPVSDTPIYNQLLGIMVKGPIFIYLLAIVAAFSAFAYSNRSAAVIGTGMSVENLSTAISASLGVLAVSTSVIISYLFSVESKVKNLDLE